ncbi:MAG: RNA polymerase sigma factor [Ktedonobacteraceae bacterium]
MGIQMDKPPHAMSLSELADRCASEISRYSHKEEYDDTYCLEIFRRALLLRDEGAWELLQNRFTPTVSSWVRRHPSREAAYRHNSEENYVALTFARFWVASVNNSRLEFNSLAAALRFLHACLNTAILDTLRTYSRPNIVPLPDPGFPEEPVSEDADDGSELWEVIRGMLPNERERRLAYLLYHCGLKPREILQRCPGEFSDVQEIYRLTRNILERLTRRKELLHRLISDEE